MNVLVTGGAGYIGSHTCVALLEQGHDIVVLDNLSNSSTKSLSLVAKITGKHFPIIIDDVQNREILDKIFTDYQIQAVLHFAGKKAVGESCEQPLMYYQNNVAATLVLCESMQENGVNTLVFSSSATVYGDPHTTPITEDFPLSATNPYGQSKLMVETVLHDLVSADTLLGKAFWNFGILRYFNPVGAHKSGLIGEDPRGIPNNLLPYIAQVAVGKLKKLSVFGGDYPTPDGSGVRDYIHVMDLAEGHVKALDMLMATDKPDCHTWNLGTGNGYTVLEMIAAFEGASKKSVPYEITARRPGDIAECWADPSKAERELSWKATRGLVTMMEDSWRWQHQNPKGFDD